MRALMLTQDRDTVVAPKVLLPGGGMRVKHSRCDDVILGSKGEALAAVCSGLRLAPCRGFGVSSPENAGAGVRGHTVPRFVAPA